MSLLKTPGSCTRILETSQCFCSTNSSTTRWRHTESLRHSTQDSPLKHTAKIHSGIPLASKKDDYLKSLNTLKDGIFDAIGSANMQSMSFAFPKPNLKMNNVTNMLTSLRKKKETEKQTDQSSQNTTEKSSEDFGSHIEEMNSSILSYYKTESSVEDKYTPIPMEMDSNYNNASDVWWTNILYNYLSVSSAKEQPVSKEKKKKFVVRQEYVSRATIDKKTLEHVQLMKRAKSTMSQQKRLEDFNNHLMMYPDSRQTAMKHGMLSTLLNMQAHSTSDVVKKEILQALAQMGYVSPPKGRGVKILSIDGGGTRGMVSLQIIREIEQRCGKPIYKLFDYVCGVSNGSIMLAILFLFRQSVSQCEEHYLECSREIVKRSKLKAIRQLAVDHSYYSPELWEKILQERMGEEFMIDFLEDEDCPKYSALSALTNVSRTKGYMFRNYNLPPGVFSVYPGSCKHKIWECVRASAAAPFYFKPFKLDEYIHQDGGILHNNPTNIAIHEAKLLWPNEDIQCIISIGTGRHEPNLEVLDEMPDTHRQVSNLISAATNTECTHMILHDILPSGTYFRFNPYLSGDFSLDEVKPENIKIMQKDTIMYLRKNEKKVEEACKLLLEPRGSKKKISDSITRFRQKHNLYRKSKKEAVLV